MSVWTGIYERDIQCKLEDHVSSQDGVSILTIAMVCQLLTSGHYRTIPSLYVYATNPAWGLLCRKDYSVTRVQPLCRP